MNKATELDRLRAFVATMPDTYIGDWLAAELPKIEMAIRGDLCPEHGAVGFSEWWRCAAALRAELARDSEGLERERRELAELRRKLTAEQAHSDRVRAEIRALAGRV